ncbi:PHP domain-containing protein [Candidatus Woesearchaeota archaeon]|nr:PHP domain-containing protein [Candidatus Woesearchaeota archaeon]
MLKCDFHLHVNEDPLDHIKYSAEELVDCAVKQGFDVLAITCHDHVYPVEKIRKYAASKGIIMIQGAEKTLQEKHVLMYNITQDDLEKTKTFDDLRKLRKRKNILVIAPHPYYPFRFCLKERLEQNIDCFDGIEYSHAHIKGFNYNKKAVEVGKKHGKPLVGMSDTHHLFQFGTTYSMVDSKKTPDAVMAAIKQGKVKYCSPPLSFTKAARIFCWVAKPIVRKLFFGPSRKHL